MVSAILLNVNKVIQSERESWLIDFTATCQAVRCFIQQSSALNDNDRDLANPSIAFTLAVEGFIFFSSYPYINGDHFVSKKGEVLHE